MNLEELYKEKGLVITQMEILQNKIKTLNMQIYELLNMQDVMGKINNNTNKNKKLDNINKL